LAYLDSNATNNVITSVSANGSLMIEPGCQGRSQVNKAPTCAYILPSTSGGGMSPIRITFSQATALAAKSWVYMAEFQPNLSGDIGLDNAGSCYQPSAASLVGPPFTSSAISDVTCEAVISAAANYAQIHVNAVSPPYDAGAYLPGGFLGFACAASNVVPTWKASSPTTAIAMGFSIGLNPDPSPSWEQTFIDFEGGSGGKAPSEATLRTSTHGWQAGHWDTSQVNTMVYATAANHPLQNPTGRLLGDGNDYAPDTGTLGVKITGAAPTAQRDYITYNWSYSNLTDMTVGAWYYTDLPAVGSDNDSLSIHGYGQQFASANCYGNAKFGRYIGLETPNGNGPPIRIKSKTWYWIQVHWRFDGFYFNHAITVRDEAGNLIGTSSHGPYSAPVDYPSYSNIGKANRSTMANGRIQYLDSIKISLVGDDPIGQ